MDELEHVISDLHPHVLGISEANFKKNHSLDEVQIQDYDLVLSKTIENDQLGVNRVVCYKHQWLVKLGRILWMTASLPFGWS